MKQRLVGALVLLSGGVVLWSVLFTGPASYKVDRETQIPPAPPLAEPEPIAPKRPLNIPEVSKEEALPEPPVPALAETAKVQQTAPAQQAPKPTAAPKVAKESAPMLDPGTGVANAWVIQVASFSSSANAETLKQRLQSQGYKAYVRAAPTASGAMLQRVFVGPELKETTALQIKAEIESSFKLKALIHKFEP
ncbi:MAG: DedD protein [Bermanella sp.]|jgi:DedD protein